MPDAEQEIYQAMSRPDPSQIPWKGRWIMKIVMLGLCGLVLCGWGIYLLGGEKVVSREYKIRVDQFDGLSEKKSDQACEQILKTYADITADLMAQLQQKSSSDEAKVYLIYLLGELRDVGAVPLLADHIDLKAPRLDPALRKARWGPYPAADALTRIGNLAVRQLISRMPKELTKLQRKLMITVIWDVYGEKCGRVVLEETLAKQTTDAGKANMKISLEAFEELKASLKQ
jgi:hypothetical protein